MIPVKSYVQKSLMKSFILFRTHSSGHENINSKDTSRPPEGTGDGKVQRFHITTNPSTFFFDEEETITQNFSQSVTNGFPAIKIHFFCFNHGTIIRTGTTCKKIPF